MVVSIAFLHVSLDVVFESLSCVNFFLQHLEDLFVLVSQEGDLFLDGKNGVIHIPKKK